MKSTMALIALFGLGQAHAQTVFVNGVLLDGNNAYVEVEHRPQLNFQGPFTVEVRVFSDQYDQSSWQEFVFKGGNSPPDQPRQYFLRPRQSTGLVEFVIHEQNGDSDGARSGQPLANGVCYHLAGVYNGTTLRLYIDGYLVDEDSTDIELAQSMEPLTFGRLGSVGAEYFDGMLDEVRLWNVARSHAQVNATLNDTLSAAYYATADSGLVGYWRLDEASGTLAEDLSVFGNHGTRIAGTSDGACELNISVAEQVPVGMRITAITPNPINDEGELLLVLPAATRLVVEVLDAQGRTVKTLLEGALPAGTHRIQLDAKALRPGAYVVRSRTAAGHSAASFAVVR